MIRKVISGGQTGVDRAALDAAVNAGIPIGGYCAKGRCAEDGVIPEQYPMIELESPESYYRTEKNVIESDGTLILNKGILSEGTRLTHDLSIKNRKPNLIVQLDGVDVIKPEHVVRWLNGQCINKERSLLRIWDIAFSTTFEDNHRHYRWSNQNYCRQFDPGDNFDHSEDDKPAAPFAVG